MKRIPVITDTHYGSRADNIILYQVQKEFYNNIFWPAIDAEGGVTDILHLGDVTDRRKYINFQTLAFAKEVFFEPAKARNIRIHWVLGNHDLPFKHSLKLSSHEAFREYDNVIVYNTPSLVKFDSVETLLVPWLCDENTAESLAMVKAFTGSVIAGHFEFNGFELYRGFINMHGMETGLFRPFPLVMSGHYHHRSSRDNIFYLGAPYEMVWSDYGSEHGFHWWTPQTHQLDFVKNPYHLYHVFTYDDSSGDPSYTKTLLDQIKASNVEQRIVKIIAKKKIQPLWFDAFADEVMKLGAHEVQFVDDTAWNVSMGNEDSDITVLDTMTMIQQYVNGLPWSNSHMQSSVTTLLTDLYQEAVAHTKST